MDRKQKLISLLGSAVILGLGAEGVTPAQAGEGKCAGMKGDKSQQTKEATCAGMKKQNKEATCAGMKKEKTKKKQKEMTCAGPGGCGGKMNKEGSKS